MSSATPGVERWGVMWMEKSGPTDLVSDAGVPVLFLTKKESRQYIRDKYGYISDRPDLRAAPHFWRMPQPVRVQITPVIQQQKRGKS